MKKKNARRTTSTTQCPIARSLDHVGEWWSILILRDAMHGYTRFDEFQKNLGIAPNMLTRRLNSLVESGLFVRRQYSEKPPRDEYILTQRGLDFLPVMFTLLDWGNRHFSPEGTCMYLQDAKTGKPITPVLVDEKTGMKLSFENTNLVPGDAASDAMRRRLAERKIPAKA